MSDVRPTDMERERAIHSLRESYARGDLDDEQFEEKLNALFAVQSSAELRELLPAPHGTVARVLAPEIAVSSNDVDLVERQLSTGERVEWIGKPGTKRRFVPEDLAFIVGGAIAVVFGVLWVIGLVNGSGAFPVFPFLVVGSGVTYGRFFGGSSRKRRTVYAVTNRRILTIVRNWKGGGETVTAFYLRSIPNISTKAGGNGRGSVDFGMPTPGRSRNTYGWDPFGQSRRQETGGLSFVDIDDPHGVADLVERLRDEAPAPNVVQEPEPPKRSLPRADARLPFPPSAPESNSEP